MIFAWISEILRNIENWSNQQVVTIGMLYTVLPRSPFSRASDFERDVMLDSVWHVSGRTISNHMSQSSRASTVSSLLESKSRSVSSLYPSVDLSAYQWCIFDSLSRFYTLQREMCMVKISTKLFIENILKNLSFWGVNFVIFAVY